MHHSSKFYIKLFRISIISTSNHTSESFLLKCTTVNWCFLRYISNYEKNNNTKIWNTEVDEMKIIAS